MTTQEFARTEVGRFVKTFNGNPNIDLNQVSLAFCDGLTKGLEIAVKALAFARQNAENGGDGCWDIWDDGGNGNCHSKTDEELLSIYLTEKYGK